MAFDDQTLLPPLLPVDEQEQEPTRRGFLPDRRDEQGKLRLMWWLDEAPTPDQQKTFDQANRLAMLQQQTGVPLGYLEQNADEIEAQVKARTFKSSVLYETPKFKAWLLENPLNPSLADADVRPLSWMEWATTMVVGAPRSALAGWLGRFGGGLWNIPRGAFETLDEATGGGPINPVEAMRQLTSPPAVYDEDMVRQPWGPAPKPQGEGPFARAARFSREMSIAGEGTASFLAGDVTWEGQPIPRRLTPTMRTILSGFESVGMMIPSLSLSIATGNPQLGLGVMVAPVGGESYGRARDEGRGIFASAVYGGLDALIEYATEKIPLTWLIKDLEKRTPFLRTMWTQLWSENIQEQVATLGQDFTEFSFLRPDATFQDYLNERPQAFVDTLIATTVATLTLTTGAKVLAQIGDVGQNTNLNKRNPEKFAEVAGRILEGTPLQFVRLPLDELKVYFQEKGESAEQWVQKLTGSLSAYQDAVDAGGIDIEVPTARYIAFIGEHKAFFDTVAKPTDAEGNSDLSMKEADAFFQAVTDQAETPADAEPNPLRERFKRELMATGVYNERTANLYALMKQKMVETLAARSGQSVDAVLRAGGQLPVVGGQEAQALLARESGRADEAPLSQDALERWRGSSQVTGVMYHATRHDFTTFDVQLGELGIHVGSVDQAGAIAGEKIPGARMMPVYIRAENPLRLRDRGTWNPNEMAKQLAELGLITDEEGERIAFKMGDYDTAMAAVRDVITRAGYDSIVYQNRREGLGDRMTDVLADEDVDIADMNDLTDEEFAQWFPNAADSYILLNANQVKSATGNVGAYSLVDDDIRFQLKPGDEPPGFDAIAPHLTEAERAKLRRNTAQHLVDIFNELPADEDLEAAAKAGRIKRGWYRRSTEALRRVFGPVDAPRFAALLAAMSPQNGVEMNLENSLRVWRTWVQEGRPTDRDTIVDIMGRSVLGTGTVDSVLDAWVNNSVRALSADDPTQVVLSGPKVNSFMQNLVGNMNEVTLDAWMQNFALLMTKLGGTINKAGTDPGKSAAYLAYAAKVRRVAQRLSTDEDTWTPAEVQETVWSWAKTLYELAESTGQTAEELLQAGALTDELIAGTPDFAQLFLNDAKVRDILESAGYGPILETLDSELAGERAGAESGRTEAAQGENTPAVTVGLLRSARRLDDLHRHRRSEARLKARLVSVRAVIENRRAEGRTRAYGRGSGRPLRGVRGQGVVNVFEPNEDFIEDFSAISLPAATLLELSTGRSGVDRFFKAITQGKAINPFGASVYRYPKAAYRGMRMFITEDGKSGFALKPDGDIVSAFSTGGGGVVHSMLELAKDEGGTKMDNFDTVLTDIYSAHGFEVTGRDPWNESYKPKDWDYDRFKWFNKGRPDVVYMQLGAEERQARSRVEGPLFQVKPEKPVDPPPPFYSQLERVVEAKMPTRASVDQVIKIVSDRTSGIRADELEWTGVVSWLKQLDQRQVTKAEVLEYIRANQLHIEEVQLGFSSEQEKRRTEMQRRLSDQSSADRGRAAELEVERRAQERAAFAEVRELVNQLPVIEVAPAVNGSGVVRFAVDSGELEYEMASRHMVTRERDVPGTGHRDVFVVQLGQTMGGADADATLEERARWALVRALGNDFFRASPEGLRFAERATQLGADTIAARQRITAEFPDLKRPPTRHQSYVLEGPHEGYRELLVRIPEDRFLMGELRVKANTFADKLDSTLKAHGMMGLLPRERARIVSGDVVSETKNLLIKTSAGITGVIEPKVRRSLLVEAQALQAKIPDVDPFVKGAHFDESNILVHLRVAEREVNGVKTLFIEEVQSDWHQAGRERGYAGATLGVDAEKKLDELARMSAEAQRLREVYRAAIRRADEAFAYLDRQMENSSEVPENWTPEWMAYEAPEHIRVPWETHGRLVAEALRAEEEMRSADRAVAALREDTPDGGEVMNAPFKSSWRELAMRRLLRRAVEEGFTQVAWTTGQQQADRYNLSRYIDTLEVTRHAAGYFVAGLKDGTTLVTKAGLTEAQLAEHVGKDLAEKAVAELQPAAIDADASASSKTARFTGLALNLGGTFHRKLYDEMLPSLVRKMTKKWGGQVVMGTLTRGELGPNEKVYRVEAYAEASGYYIWDNVNMQVVEEEEGVERQFDTATEARAFINTELGGSMANIGKPVHLLVITPEMRASVLDGQPLFQADQANHPTAPLGFSVTRPGEPLTIGLLEKADLSTFLHEMSHVQLALMRRLMDELPPVDQRDAQQQQFAADFDALVRFSGAESYEAMAREHHEKLAQGFEAWFREGKAPTEELRSAFATFRAWMLWLYQNLTGLNNVQLTDEVRDVFGRLLATDEQITLAQQEAQLQPLFADRATAGMSEIDWAEYQRLMADASDEAKRDLEEKVLREWRREQTRFWQELRAPIEAAVTERVHAMPAYRALWAMQYGKKPDGTPLLGDEPTRIALDKQAIIDLVGKDGFDALPRPYIHAKEGGLHPDQVAEMFGYHSGRELLQAMMGIPAMSQVIEREVQAEMVARHGDMTRDGSLPEAARESVYAAENRDTIVRAELRALHRGMTAGVPSARALNARAAQDVARTPVGRLQPGRYLQAAQRASQKAYQLLAEGGNRAEAIQAKQDELVALARYRAALKARDDVERRRQWVRDHDSPTARQKLGKAGSSYLEQWDGILDRFEFKVVTNKTLARRSSLRDFLNGLQAGMAVDMPDEVLNEAFRSNYAELTYEELIGVTDGLKHLYHLATKKNELFRKAEKRRIDELALLIRERVEMFSKGTKDVRISTDLPEGKFARSAAGFSAWQRKYASLIRQMDGDVDGGLMWEYLVRPMNEAADRETEMRVAAGEALLTALQRYTVAERAALLEKIDLPEIGDALPRQALLMVGLNWGNAQNRQRMMSGYGWSQEQVEQMLGRLTAKDWAVIKDVWSLVNSYWPEFQAKQIRVFGVAPEKVEALPFQTAHGQMPGGYFPIIFDPETDARSYDQQMATLAKEALQGAYAGQSTRRNHGQKRLEGDVHGRRVWLSFAAIERHLDMVIHDLTHHEMLLDVNRLLRHPEVAGTIQAHYGKEAYRALTYTLTDVARGYGIPNTPGGKVLDHLRKGTSFAYMGWSLITSAVQPLGLTVSVKRLGAKWVLRGVRQVFADASQLDNSVTWIHEQSSFMRNRHNTLMREVNEVRNTIQPRGSFMLARAGKRVAGEAGAVAGQRSAEVYHAIEDTYFQFIAKMQMVADVPTWLAAYQKAQAEGNDHARSVALADQAVIDTQGSGHIKDLAMSQRQDAFAKMFTQFMSYFSVVYNQAAESVGRTKWNDPWSVARLGADMLMLYTVPMVLESVIRAALQGEGPDDDESYVAWMAKNQFSYALSTVVFAREFSALAMGYRYRGPAGAGFFSAAYEAGQQAMQGDIDEALIRSGWRTIGMLFHLPAAQVERTVNALLALEEDGVAAAFNRLFGGRKKAG